MIKRIALALLILSSAAFAQTTIATGTVTNPAGTAQASCTWTATLQNPSGQAATVNGGPVTTPVTGTCSGAGVITATLTDNNIIQPPGTSWQFVVIAAAGGPQFTNSVKVAGPTFALPFTGAMPPLSALSYVPFIGAPSGACLAYTQTAQNVSNGDYYDCLPTVAGSTTGTWTKVTGAGGGSLTLAGVAGDLQMNGTTNLAAAHMNDGGTVAGYVSMSEPLSMGTGHPITETETTGTTGVTQYLLCSLDSSGNVVTSAANATGVYGICQSTQTSGQSVQVAKEPSDTLAISGGAITINDLVGTGTTPGEVYDLGVVNSNGVAANVQVIGRSTSSAAGAGSQIHLAWYGPGHYGTLGTSATVNSTVCTANGCDIHSGSTTAGFLPPSGAGAVPTTAGVISFDTTAEAPVYGNGTTTKTVVGAATSTTATQALFATATAAAPAYRAIATGDLPTAQVTRTSCATDLAPVTGDDLLITLLNPATAVTITRFSCGVTGTTSVVSNLVKATLSLMADQTCTAGDANVVNTATFVNGSSQCGGTSSCAVAAHAPVTVHVGTISGTPTGVTWCIDYTVN